MMLDFQADYLQIVSLLIRVSWVECLNFISLVNGHVVFRDWWEKSSPKVHNMHFVVVKVTWIPNTCSTFVLCHCQAASFRRATQWKELLHGNIGILIVSPGAIKNSNLQENVQNMDYFSTSNHCCYSSKSSIYEILLWVECCFLSALTLWAWDVRKTPCTWHICQWIDEKMLIPKVILLRV